MHALLKEGQRVRVRPHDGFWLDIGRPDDYQEVCERWSQLAPRLLSGGYAA
jgi:NDP-sugar pyrophosphorylase family protein